MADGDGRSGGGSTEVLALLNSINQGINNIAKQLQAVFPQGSSVTTSAGAATGQYYVIQLPDGTTRKIALLSP